MSLVMLAVSLIGANWLKLICALYKVVKNNISVKKTLPLILHC
jgi:hypothetical protein